MHAYTRWCETCWLLLQRGALDDTTYRSRELSIMYMLNPKGGREWWDTIKMEFDDRFADRINQQLEHATEETGSIVRDIPFYRPENWKIDNDT